LLRDAQSTTWSKVIVDDFRLTDAAGTDIDTIVEVVGDPPSPVQAASAIDHLRDPKLGTLSQSKSAGGDTPARPNATEVGPSDLQFRFPLSFEDAQVGHCPTGWHCSGSASPKVCRVGVGGVDGSCEHPGIHGVDGMQYFTVGNDFNTGSAISAPFVLPAGVDKIVFLRSGGADDGSGFYLRRHDNGQVLCSAENGQDTNGFFEGHCEGLVGYTGEGVYMEIRDTQSSGWGKVMVDDIRLLDSSGKDISAARMLDPRRGGWGASPGFFNGISQGSSSKHPLGVSRDTCLRASAALLAAAGATSLGFVAYRWIMGARQPKWQHPMEFDKTTHLT
jgi:hypothetical protein